MAIQNFARAILEEDGYFVLTAGNGEVALLLSQQYPGHIHLLLTDVVMPNMSGVELSKRISAERPGIQIVLMSGHSFVENINPMHAFLQKPFVPEQLSDTIKELLPLRHATGT